MCLRRSFCKTTKIDLLTSHNIHTNTWFHVETGDKHNRMKLSHCPDDSTVAAMRAVSPQNRALLYNITRERTAVYAKRILWWIYFGLCKENPVVDLLRSMQRESCGGFTAFYAKRIQWWIYCVLCKENPVVDLLRSMQKESSGGFTAFYAKRIQWWIYCGLCKENPVVDLLRSTQRESSGGFIAFYAKRIQWWMYCVLCKGNPVVDLNNTVEMEARF